MTEACYWVGTSWKMNKTLPEATDFAARLAAADDRRDSRIQRFVMPPFTAVREVRQQLEGTSVKVGAQNMHWADAGAWTGEISPPMLVDCGLEIVEIGHSERRAHFGETNETVAMKAEAAVRHGLIPLICIGETLEDREAGRATEVLETQVRTALARIEERPGAVPVLLAYEPVWAIGDGGIPATAEYADARHTEITSVAKEMLSQTVRCLYGGSVNPGNCSEFIQCPHVDGLFIGRSAWDAEGYLGILDQCASVI